MDVCVCMYVCVCVSGCNYVKVLLRTFLGNCCVQEAKIELQVGATQLTVFPALQWW